MATFSDGVAANAHWYKAVDVFIGNVTQVTFLLVFFNHVPVRQIVELGLISCPAQLTLSSSI